MCETCSEIHTQLLSEPEGKGPHDWRIAFSGRLL
jgi:hypothetical protein